MDRFVVGTGRCGSTLLSRMLAAHRDVVTIHEFFTGLDAAARFTPGPVQAAGLLGIVTAEQPVTTMVLARGHTSDEIQYPFGTAHARYRPGDPMPWLLVSMVPRLTDDPDTLYAAFCAYAATLPDAPVADHYRRLFAWLTARCGGTVWVERSGSSIDYLGELARLFPTARFVHIHRDGLEAALSIRAHPFFRLAVHLVYGLLPDPGRVPDPITYAIETPPPLWAVGRFWSDQLLRGFPALAQLDREQYLAVAFEDLVAEPATVLDRIAAFLDLRADPEFLSAATAMVRSVPPSRATTLTAEERHELAAACRPGMVLLGRSG